MKGNRQTENWNAGLAIQKLQWYKYREEIMAHKTNSIRTDSSWR